jgi:hypothetical protein
MPLNKTVILGNHICGKVSSRSGIRRYPAITTYGSVRKHSYAFAQYRISRRAGMTSSKPDVAEFANAYRIVQNAGFNRAMVTNKDI